MLFLHEYPQNNIKQNIKISVNVERGGKKYGVSDENLTSTTFRREYSISTFFIFWHPYYTNQFCHSIIHSFAA